MRFVAIGGKRVPIVKGQYVFRARGYKNRGRTPLICQKLDLVDRDGRNPNNFFRRRFKAETTVVANQGVILDTVPHKEGRQFLKAVALPRYPDDVHQASLNLHQAVQQYQGGL